jgi:hypothetical protein
LGYVYVGLVVRGLEEDKGPSRYWLGLHSAGSSQQQSLARPGLRVDGGRRIV